INSCPRFCRTCSNHRPRYRKQITSTSKRCSHSGPQRPSLKNPSGQINEGGRVKDNEMAAENKNQETEQQPPLVAEQVAEKSNEAETLIEAQDETRIESDESQHGKDKTKWINRILSFAVPLLILSLAFALWYL